VTAPLRTREPRQDRSRATREALLDATIELLSEVGWPGTTVVAVAARAGVSRGAAQHHFATRDELVRAAVERVSADLTDQMRASRDVLASEPDRELAVIEMLAALWTGTFGRAATHLWVAASTDASLRALVLPLERRLNRDVYVTTLELLGIAEADAEAETAVRLTLDLVRGIGIAALLRPGLERRHSDLAAWAAQLAAVTARRSSARRR
jgi:AcrR family transcriptional regulator